MLLVSLVMQLQYHYIMLASLIPGSGYLSLMVYALLLHTAMELVLAAITYSKYVGLAIGRIVLVLIVAELLWILVLSMC